MKKRYTYLTFFLMVVNFNEIFENEVTFLEFQSGEVKKNIGKVIRLLNLVSVNSQKYSG